LQSSQSSTVAIDWCSLWHVRVLLACLSCPDRGRGGRGRGQGRGSHGGLYCTGPYLMLGCMCSLSIFASAIRTVVLFIVYEICHGYCWTCVTCVAVWLCGCVCVCACVLPSFEPITSCCAELEFDICK